MRTDLRRTKAHCHHLSVVGSGGLLGGRSSSTNFYMLSPLSPAQAKTALASAEARIHIGLEAVVMAEYLNRNEIVINLDNTVYRLAEFNQWAEP